MVFCTFCGCSCDEKCLRKTRIYPHAPIDDFGKQTLRGPICKLCDRKFYINKEVCDLYELIKGAKKTLQNSLLELASKGQETKQELQEESSKSNYTAEQISAVDNDILEMRKEIMKLKGDRKAKKKNNTLILNEKETLEKQVRQMQEDTEKLESIYKELLLLTNELKLIKKNELPSIEFGTAGTPRGKERTKSDAMSQYSQEIEMMVDMPADFDGGFEQGDSNDVFEIQERIDTLNSSRRESVTSESSNKNAPTVSKTAAKEKMRREKAANLPAGKSGGVCGGPDDACCLIF